VGHRVDACKCLDGVVAGGEVDDVARVFHDPHSKDFLAVVAACTIHSETNWRDNLQR